MAPECDNCYYSQMHNLGLDCNGVLWRLEEWAIENIPRLHTVPILSETEPQLWPWGRREQVRILCWNHMMAHGIPAQVQRDGVFVDDYRCPEWPCKKAGISFAHFEIMLYLESMRMNELLQLIERCEAFLRRPENLHHALRSDVAAFTRYLRQGFTSAQLRVGPTGGRPKTPLAQAVAQHLQVGGFKLVEIAEFMGTTADACRKRCTSEDSRALVPYVPDAIRHAQIELA